MNNVNDNDILYLLTKETDNTFVRQMIEKGLVPTVESSDFPHFEISKDKVDIYYRHSSSTGVKNLTNSVGGFELLKLWRKFNRHGGSYRKEPFAKAIGFKNISQKKLVVDMSCGTGKDSLLLLSFGARLISFERDPVIYLLLFFYKLHLDLEDSFPKDRFQIINGTPSDYFFSENPSVIYFDPMYSAAANKKSAPRKHMAEFREFIGEDHDYKEHFGKALEVATERVVVKRPSKSSFIEDKKPSHSIIGKSTRYDVYLTKI